MSDIIKETPETHPELFPIFLPDDCERFTGISGKVYTVERQNRLSVERDQYLEKFGLECMLNRTIYQFILSVKKAYEANNAGKPGDVGVILDDIMKGAANFLENPSPLLMICTLFVNAEGEDRRTYNPEDGRTKIYDWRHIESRFFFLLAVQYLSITGEQLNLIMESSLGAMLPLMKMKGSLSENS